MFKRLIEHLDKMFAVGQKSWSSSQGHQLFIGLEDLCDFFLSTVSSFQLNTIGRIWT